MPEVGGVGGQVPPQNQNQVTDRGGQVLPVNQANAQVDGLPAPAGQPGALGQPTGLPAPPLAPGQTVLPDVLAGRDPSQLVAAEQMRARGGASAVEALLGLNNQPTLVGALAAPPGNTEALRHMTPTMRRTLMRNLLDKQRASMRRLAQTLRRERDGGEEGGDADERRREEQEDVRASFVEDTLGAAGVHVALAPLDEAQAERARLELGNAAQMLDLLEELLAMQDYAISQMGTFAQG
ncbi:MAG TPA: hypothetical protein VFX96_18415 [Pyrinomonadaceae bacterium]|nr:hypothetical protein [Pyrinomonadaceae bacterium]